MRSAFILVYVWLHLVVYVWFWAARSADLAEVDLCRPCSLVYLLWHYGRQRQMRRLGTTVFAEARAYDEAALSGKISDRHRREYFRDGFTVVRGALPPELLKALSAKLLADFGSATTYWNHQRSFNSDALLDFYLYSNAGALAAAIFASAGTDTEHEAPSVYLIRDFMYARHPGVPGSWWHRDVEDCPRPELPLNYTRANGVRVWIPLADNISAPIFMNHSVLLALAAHGEETLRTYWRGEANSHLTVLFQQRLPDEDLLDMLFRRGGIVQPPGMRLGDVIVHTLCGFHVSPPPAEVMSPSPASATSPGPPAVILFPTYGFASMRLEPKSNARFCVPENGASIVAEAPTCYLQAYPNTAQPKRGDVFWAQFFGDARQWFLCSLGSNGKEGIFIRKPGC